MRVIFLDFDGVLNLIPQGHDEFGGVFHPHFVNNLKRIIEVTGAKLVISSSWRFMGLEQLHKMWASRQYPGEIIDITPDCVDICDAGLFEHYDHVERGHEIQFWLDKHPEVSQYVILDDDADMLQSQLSNFVQTRDNYTHTDYIDIGYGLTKECAEKAIEILTR